MCKNVHKWGITIAFMWTKTLKMWIAKFFKIFSKKLLTKGCNGGILNKLSHDRQDKKEL